MKRSTIESLIKLPLQIPFETSVRVSKETEIKNTINKPVHKKETVDQIHGAGEDLSSLETPSYSKGYIKYPRYDFF